MKQLLNKHFLSSFLIFVGGTCFVSAMFNNTYLMVNIATDKEKSPAREWSAANLPTVNIPLIPQPKNYNQADNLAMKSAKSQQSTDSEKISFLEDDSSASSIFSQDVDTSTIFSGYSTDLE